MISFAPLLTIASLFPGPSPVDPPPNIVIVLVDDLGTDFLPFYHAINPYKTALGVPIELHEGTGLDPTTPNEHLYVEAPELASFAQQGVLFLNAYAQATCSPSRASLLTGNYPVRHGVGTVFAQDAETVGELVEFGQEPTFDSMTLAELVELQPHGFDTQIVGKWHLGRPTTAMAPPANGGDDSHLGWESIPDRGGWNAWACIFTAVNHRPYPPSPKPWNCDQATSHHNPGKGTYYNFMLAENTTDQTQVTHVVCSAPTTSGPGWNYEASVLFDKALDWCNNHSSEGDPFLCMISLNTVHFPYEYLPPNDLINTDTYEDATFGSAFITTAAMIEAIDTELGNFYDGLECDLRDNTLFLFLGDNGSPPTPVAWAKSHGTTGVSTPPGMALDLGDTYDLMLEPPASHIAPSHFKGTVFEKGVRVPMIAWGAGVSQVEGGRQSKALVQIEDIFATVADLLDHTIPATTPSVSFRWVLENQNEPGNARQMIWSQTFGPNGRAGTGVAHAHSAIGCSLKIPGSGRFKLIRRSSTPGADYPDLLFKLEDNQANPYDPWETEALDHGVYAYEYNLLDDQIAAVLATGTWQND